MTTTRLGLELRLDTSEWSALRVRLKEFDPALQRALRIRLVAAGNDAADAVKNALNQPTPEGNPDGPGRDALMAGTRVQVSFSARSAGVKIITSASHLPGGHAALLKLYNTASFRHPVFGTNTWVGEQGNPYFEVPIERTVGVTMYREIDAALDEAIAAIGGRL